MPRHFPSILLSNGIHFYFDHILSPSEALYTALDELHQVKIKVTEYDGEYIGSYDLDCDGITEEENLIYFD